jgi:hypothetical protein
MAIHSNKILLSCESEEEVIDIYEEELNNTLKHNKLEFEKFFIIIIVCRSSIFIPKTFIHFGLILFNTAFEAFSLLFIRPGFFLYLLYSFSIVFNLFSVCFYIEFCEYATRREKIFH